MIAVDTNVLVHAHRGDSPFHDRAAASLRELAEGLWAIPWPCLHEFLSIVTHPRVFHPPTPLDVARKTVAAWVAAPTVTLLSELDDYWPFLDRVLASSRVSGPRIHDARIAALCLQHAVTELWTADRDFGRFPGLRVRNPLLDGA
ncbi:MAG: PIN domain-containing protein [Deltaproteobacteria bacterium]|nr:PIN domain-containing protein [Deltaproteobacteria bacterium]